MNDLTNHCKNMEKKELWTHFDPYIILKKYSNKLGIQSGIFFFFPGSIFTRTKDIFPLSRLKSRARNPLEKVRKWHALEEREKKFFFFFLFHSSVTSNENLKLMIFSAQLSLQIAFPRSKKKGKKDRNLHSLPFPSRKKNLPRFPNLISGHVCGREEGL